MKKTFFLLLFLLPMLVKAQVALTTSTPSYTQNFDGLITTGTATWSDNTTIPNWYAARSVAGAVTLRSNNGTGNSGGLQSFGLDTDRAIGGIGSGTNGTNAFGLRLKNSTGAALTAITIRYTGEQWRNGGNTSAHKLVFSYSISPTAFTAVSINPTDSSYVAVPNLDFTSPTIGATAAALDGNLAANKTAITYSITGINLPDGSEMMIRWFDADDLGSDHGIGVDDLTVSAGVVANTNPTVSVSATALSGFSTTEGAASSTKTYTVSGVNLKADIVATAPNGFEISTSATTGFASTLNFAPVSGTVASTTVYVRLKGTTQGNFTGNITHTSTDAASQNITLSGLVAAVTGLTPIATAKGLTDNTVVTVEGRLTVTSQYGGKLVYVQDATGGLAVFANNTAIYPNNWQIGDSVRVTGPIITFSGKREILDPTLVTIVSGQTNKPVTPSVIAADKLNVNEGRLVTINNAGFINTSGNFAGAQNYSFATCTNLLGVFRINNSVNNLVGTAIPKTIQNLTGVVENFNGAYQILPRFTTDLSAAASQCDISGALCNPAAVVIPDSNINFNTTLDVVAWNIEWFGNLTQTPANDTLQANNVKCALDKLKSDIMVLVEVCDTNKLRAILPTGYDVRFSGKYYSHFYDTGETAADLAQKVAVVYNKSTITPIEAECKALLTNFADFSANGATNSFWASGRLPYMFTANATINNVTRKIRVVGIHAKAGSDAASYTRRVSDVSALKKHLDSLYTKDLLILAGDYNDDVDTSISAGKSSSYADFVKDTNYVVLSRALSLTGKKSTASFTDMIDHITATKSLAAFYVPNSVNVATAASMSFIPEYSATTTDHFPVWARFRLLTSSVQTIREDFKTEVYPNPTDNIINIAFDKIANDTEISLYDISGRVIFNKKYASTTLISMDLTPFPNGFYHLEVKQDTAKSLKKVVKF